jgi:hypothetical protein
MVKPYRPKTHDLRSMRKFPELVVGFGLLMWILVVGLGSPKISADVVCIDRLGSDVVFDSDAVGEGSKDTGTGRGLLYKPVGYWSVPYVEFSVTRPDTVPSSSRIQVSTSVLPSCTTTLRPPRCQSP